MEPANIWIWAAKTSKKMQVWWKYTSHVACDVYINLVLHILRIWCNKCTIKTPEKNRSPGESSSQVENKNNGNHQRHIKLF